MKRLYEKSELLFALLWIFVYCTVLSVAEYLSGNINIQKVITAPVCIIFSIFLFWFVKKNKLSEKYGLCKPLIPAKKVIFYLPLLIIASINLWYGVALSRSPLENVFYMVSMVCIGFMEEILFRGFLFKALCKKNLKMAVVVSSAAFGAGHFLKLFNGSGATVFSTFLQAVYAAAIGFLFVTLFYKTKSLIACIVTHSAINTMSTFANGNAFTPEVKVFNAVILTVTSLAYAVYINRFVKTDGESV